MNENMCTIGIAADEIEGLAELAQAIERLPANSERVTNLALGAAEDAKRVAANLRRLGDGPFKGLACVSERLQRIAELFLTIAELPAGLHELRCALARRCAGDLSCGGYVANGVDLLHESIECSEVN